ncbi:glycosyl transferase family 90-domain-containing protein [Aspergillus cavernicola]|uniref:Glycosyl transferase family 90-domain-containing protein n=1 Tax=Aspergillus cavernicola TaxID=176166 RepID=A0ABR4I268_9EURO
MPPSPSRWLYGSLLSALGFLAFSSFAAGLLLWYAVNSDRDYFHPILTQLIPAGHCACETATVFECSTCLTCSHKELSATPAETWEFDYKRDGQNAGLSRSQCDAAFPGLIEDVVRAGTYWRKQGGLSSVELDEIPLRLGMGRARIARGELYVIAFRAHGEDHRRKILATLSAIHRALVTDPNRTTRPEIEFVFSVEDKLEDVANAHDPVWTMARTADEEAAWLMPDFGYWAWDHLHTAIGPYDQVVERAAQYDIPWEGKQHQLVWRGKPSFAPKLRRALMDATRDQPWADVQPVDWHEQSNVLRMEDHCKYMFIAHVEGRSYSASLKYRQACRSVIVAHQLQYIQHHHYLLVSSGPQQNYVEVARDFSNLADQLEPLLADSAKAERIADNSIKTFRERYLTMAAEACYWRSLWDGYGGVWNGSAEAGDSERPGLRYESFILQGSEQMLDFHISIDTYT